MTGCVFLISSVEGVEVVSYLKCVLEIGVAVHEFDLSVSDLVESGKAILFVKVAAKVGVAVLHLAGLQFIDQIERQLDAAIGDKEPGVIPVLFACGWHADQARSSALTSFSESCSAVNCGSLGGYSSSSAN